MSERTSTPTCAPTSSSRSPSLIWLVVAIKRLQSIRRPSVAQIFTDYAGLGRLRLDLGAPAFEAVVCRLRVVDAFGTSLPFIKNWFKAPGAVKLDLRPSWTLHPVTPFNSFLGFALTAGHHRQSERPAAARPRMLIWGKSEAYFGGEVGRTSAFTSEQISTYLKCIADEGVELIAMAPSAGGGAD